MKWQKLETFQGEAVYVALHRMSDGELKISPPLIKGKKMKTPPTNLEYLSYISVIDISALQVSPSMSNLHRVLT